MDAYAEPQENYWGSWLDLCLWSGDLKRRHTDETSYTGSVYRWSPMLTQDRLCALHETLLGDAPNGQHQSLYGTFPKRRGFSDRRIHIARFEAAFVLALAQTLPMGSGKMRRVMFFVAPSAETWAVEQMGRIAKVIFGRFKAEGNVKGAQLLGDAFKNVMMGKYVLQVAEEPERWACFGFRATDPVPEWMRDSLLTGV